MSVSAMFSADRMNTRSRTRTGVSSVTYRCACRGTDFEKTMMNVIRYSASGTIHKSGIDRMSVETCVVTASIRLDGTAARRSQRTLVGQDGGGSSAGGAAARLDRGSGARGGGALKRARPQAAIRNTSTTKPAAQTQAWWTSRRFGSTTNGYATRASRLPKLLAA